MTTRADRSLLPFLRRLRDLVGCAGGLLIGGALHLAARVGHRGAPLPAPVRDMMAEFFADLELDRVRLVSPGMVPPGFAAITLHTTIRIRRPFDARDPASLLLLMHELVHVRQFARMGAFSFYCAYGREILRYGYAGAPLEIEARRLVAENRLALAARVAAAPA